MTKRISPIGRVSYPHVYEAVAAKDSDRKKFSVTLLFDKTADLSAMKELASEVAKEKWPKGLPEGFRSPFRDGDKKTNKDGDQQPEYAGMTYIQFKSNEDRRPQVVDAKVQPILKDDGDFYSGCYAMVSYGCYAYDISGNKGVAFGLNNVQKVRDGERFDGGSSADDDFETIGGQAETELVF